VDESPLALSSSEHLVQAPSSGNTQSTSGPRKVTMSNVEMGRSLNPIKKRGATPDLASGRYGKAEEFELDEKAPLRAVRSNRQASGEVEGGPNALLPHVDGEDEKDGPGNPVNGVTGSQDLDGSRQEGWGESFKIEWLCTDRLPFFRARHIRNPWNHDREVKVSRDGTELEPSVGQKLLQEWSRLSEPQPSQAATGSNRPVAAGASRRGLGIPQSAPVTPMTTTRRELQEGRS